MTLLLLPFVLILSSCTQKPVAPSLSGSVNDDEVLIEFATRLEDDYNRLYQDKLNQLPENPHPVVEPGFKPSNDDNNGDHPPMENKN
jgi:hypothetical protein